jgi:hypothetical protein
MNCNDFEFEEIVISEAISLPFHGFDFVVGASIGLPSGRWKSMTASG